MKNAYHWATVVGGAWLLGSSFATAVAQQAENGAAAQNTEIQEIVVTANKREENVNKVGVTVTAISGDDLRQRQIVSLADLAAAVPSLSYAPSGIGTPILTLRGIGFNERTLGVYPAVSIYVDEAPLPFPVMTIHSAFDLQRVEVLKGPQGTLFGENSTGGAINYVAAKPTKEFESGGSLTAGRFNEVAGDAYISGPVSNTVGMRLAVTALNQEGWQQSYTRPGDTNGKQSFFAGRLITDWAPTDKARFALTLDGWHDGSQPQAPQFIAVRPQQPAAVHPEVLAYPFPLDNNRSAEWSVGVNQYTGAYLAPGSDRNLYHAALRGDFDLTDSVTLTSLTSYSYLKQQLSSDQDGVGGPQPPVAGTANAPGIGLEANLAPSDGSVHSFNQEVRIANTSKSSDRWVVGANFERSTTFEDQILNFGDNSTDAPGFLNINTVGARNAERFTNFAVFANNEYDLNNLVTLKAGVRFTSTKDDATICQYGADNGATAALFNLIPTFLGLPAGNIKNGDCYALNDQAPKTSPDFFQPGGTYHNTLKEHNVSWRVGPDFHLSENALIYANVSKGYKAGSFPTLAGSTFSENTPVTQESVLAYEVGSKIGMWDRRIQLNDAVFYYDYKDKQIRGKLVDPIFNILDVLVNVPKSRVYGAEVDLTVKPVDALTVQGTVTYLKSEVRDYTGPTVYGDTANFAGAPLPFTPRWIAGLNADYRFPLATGGKGFVGTSIKTQSESVSVLGGENIAAIQAGPGVCSAANTAACYKALPGLQNPFVLPSYTTVDVRLGYESASGHWTAMLWGKNIFNRYYFTSSDQVLDITSRYTGMPAQFGLTVNFKN